MFRNVPSRFPWALLLLAPVLLGSCASSITQLIVVVRTDYTVPSEANQLVVRVHDENGLEQSSQQWALSEAEEQGEVLPLSFGVEPAGGDANRTVTLNLTLSLDDAVLVSREVVVGFVAGKQLLLEVTLQQSCAAVSCEGGDTCVSGTCTSAVIDATTLPEVDPGNEFTPNPTTGACDDGIKNGQETDADCGGGSCGTCTINQMCGAGSDCASGFCDHGTCQDSCGDGVVNGTETGVDCGGGACGPCGQGLACTQYTDCIAGVCSGGVCAETCSDGTKNGYETDVDCGGPGCSACVEGEACQQHDDCISTLCDNSLCRYPESCQDAKNAFTDPNNGVFAIKPDPMGTTYNVYCDMTTDGGGWTLVSSTNDEPPMDHGGGYHSELSTLLPTGRHESIWDGLRPLITANSDIRFACKGNDTDIPMTVDLSFYNNGWYTELTASTNEASVCFQEDMGNGYDGAVDRRNNLTNTIKTSADEWDVGYLEAEPGCSSAADFLIDFDDGGTAGTSDDTDWGEEIGGDVCGTNTDSTDMSWFIFVREP